MAETVQMRDHKEYAKQMRTNAVVINGVVQVSQELWEQIATIIENSEEVVHWQNISPMHPVDEFQCSKCGIILRDWSEVTIDEDELDEQYNEYEFKYCPNCGAKMDGGNEDG